MKKLLTVTAISVAVMLVLVPIASAQQEKAPPAQERPPAGAPGGQQAEKVFQGQLVKVDPQAKWISVKGAGDMEMQFDYTDATQVVGEKGIQGLAGKTGTELKVTYRDAAGKHTATKIEVSEKGK